MDKGKAIVEGRLGERLDILVFEYLKENGYKDISRSMIQNIWEEIVLLNGNLGKCSYKLKEQDVLEVDIQRLNEIMGEMDRSRDILAEDGDLQVVFESKDVVIVDKPQGMVVHPGFANSRNTLANRVRGYLEKKGEFDDRVARAGIVHRLDKPVGGLIVFAKNLPMQVSLQKQFENHLVKKVYLADIEEYDSDVDNTLSFPEEALNVEKEVKDLEKNQFLFDESWVVLEGYISRDSRNRLKMLFRKEKLGNARYSLSYIKPVGRNKVLVCIETGRMHQIRATLEYLSLRIKGDSLYGLPRGNSLPLKISLRSIYLQFLDLDEERVSVFKLK